MHPLDLVFSNSKFCLLQAILSVDFHEFLKRAKKKYVTGIYHHIPIYCSYCCNKEYFDMFQEAVTKRFSKKYLFFKYLRERAGFLEKFIFY